MRRIQDLVERAVSLSSGLSQEMRTLVLGIEDPLRLAYVLASLLDMKAADKQQLLEENTLIEKLQAVAKALDHEIALLELKGKIESAAQQEMTDAQRQYYLRQQLKAIQDELGEGEKPEAQELRKRIADAHLPEQVATPIAREVDRLERMTPASPEYQMIRTYIDWVLDVPWSTFTEDRLDPVAARKVLDEDHYDLDKVKERIVEYLAVQKLKAPQGGAIRGPILCFVGPPGVGKTSLGQSIARAMNRKFVRISLGGVRDEAEIRGHRRTYIGAIPGTYRAGAEAGGRHEPGVHARRDRQDQRRLSGRSRRGAARSARPGAEPLVPRSLSRDQRRSVARAVHRHLESARHDPSGAARPDGDHSADRLQRGGEAAHRAAVSGSATARRERSDARPDSIRGRRDAPNHLGLHARSRRSKPRTADRRRLPQDRRAGRRRKRRTRRDA